MAPITRMAAVMLELQQPDKIIHTDSDLPNDRPQRAGIELSMIRHHRLCKRSIPPQDDVTSVLTSYMETEPL